MDPRRFTISAEVKGKLDAAFVLRSSSNPRQWTATNIQSYYNFNKLCSTKGPER